MFAKVAQLARQLCIRLCLAPVVGQTTAPAIYIFSEVASVSVRHWPWPVSQSRRIFTFYQIGQTAHARTWRRRRPAAATSISYFFPRRRWRRKYIERHQHHDHVRRACSARRGPLHFRPLLRCTLHSSTHESRVQLPKQSIINVSPPNVFCPDCLEWSAMRGYRSQPGRFLDHPSRLGEKERERDPSGRQAFA